MSLYFPYNLVVFFLKLNYCLNIYYETNSDSTALSDQSFINLSWIEIWLLFLSEDILWSVRIWGAQYCSEYSFESCSRFFTFKQNKRILIFIINSWTIYYRTGAEVKIPPIIYPCDIYWSYSRSDLLNQMLYKLPKDRSDALKNLIIQSAVSTWRQYKMLEVSWSNIIKASVSFLAFGFFTIPCILLFFLVIWYFLLFSKLRSLLLLKMNLCHKCH